MSIAGIQISSLKPYLQTEDDARSTFKRLAQMGCRVVQLQWLSPALAPAWVANQLEKAGLISVSTQDFFEQVQKDWPLVLEMNRRCASRHVCVSGIPGNVLDAAACQQFVQQAKQMIGELANEGMVLSFHPRSREYGMVDGKTAVDWVLERLPEMMLGLDCYHAWRAGQDCAALIRRYGARVDFIHCKDYLPAHNGVRLVPVGQGCVDWQPILDACLEVQVPWVFAEQETWDGDAFQCMAESLSYLKSRGLPTG